MLIIPEGVMQDIQIRAAEMINEGQTFITFHAPGGNRMFDITTDQTQLNSIVATISIDDTPVFIGERTHDVSASL